MSHNTPRELSRILLKEALRLGDVLVSEGRDTYAYAMLHALCSTDTKEQLAPHEEAVVRMRMCEICLTWEHDKAVRAVRVCIDELRRLHSRHALSPEMVLRFSALRIRAHQHTAGDTQACLTLIASACTEARAFNKRRWLKYFTSLRALYTPLLGLNDNGTPAPPEVGAPHYDAVPSSTRPLLNQSERDTAPPVEKDVLSAMMDAEEEEQEQEEEEEEEEEEEKEKETKEKDVIDADVSQAVGQLMDVYEASLGRPRKRKAEDATVSVPRYIKKMRAEGYEDGEWYPCTVVRGSYERTVTVRFDGEEETTIQTVEDMRKTDDVTAWELMGMPYAESHTEAAELSRILVWAEKGMRIRALHAASSALQTLRTSTTTRTGLSYKAEVGLHLVSAQMQCALLNAAAATQHVLAAANIVTEKALLPLVHNVHLAAVHPLILHGDSEAAMAHIDIARTSKSRLVSLLASALRVTTAPLVNQTRQDEMRLGLDEVWREFRLKVVSWQGRLPALCRHAAEVAQLHSVDVNVMCDTENDASEGVTAEAAHSAYLSALRAAKEEEDAAGVQTHLGRRMSHEAQEAHRIAALPTLQERIILADHAQRYPPHRAGQRLGSEDGEDEDEEEGDEDRTVHVDQKHPAATPLEVLDLKMWLPGNERYPGFVCASTGV